MKLLAVHFRIYVINCANEVSSSVGQVQLGMVNLVQGEWVDELGSEFWGQLGMKQSSP